MMLLLYSHTTDITRISGPSGMVFVIETLYTRSPSHCVAPGFPGMGIVSIV